MSVVEKQDNFTTAAAKAKELGMRRKNDVTTVRFGQPVLLVTADEIVEGTIRTTHVREDDSRSDIYSVAFTELCSFTFKRLTSSPEGETEWEETPAVEISLPEGAVLYAGRTPKETLKTPRKRGYRY